jgi:hypothetical protein
MRVIRTALFAVIFPAIAFAHSGGQDIKGTIAQFDQRTLLVKRADGKRQSVPLTASTAFLLGKKPGVWRDMHAGSRVVVHIGHDGKAIEVHLPARR